MGSGIGFIIAAIVLTVWLALGKLMSWDSNWWLTIGTYTGLVGFIDGFVLHNVYFRETEAVNDQFEALAWADGSVFDLLNLPMPEEAAVAQRSLDYRINRAMGVLCSLPQAVLASVVAVVALLAIATGMHWSEAGRLMCNTPTMIIEGFLLLVLIQVHNMANIKMRVQFREILVRRPLVNKDIEQTFSC